MQTIHGLTKPNSQKSVSWLSKYKNHIIHPLFNEMIPHPDHQIKKKLTGCLFHDGEIYSHECRG
jgi:hypothetical protein